MSRIKQLASAAVCIVAAGYVYQRLALRRDRRRFPAPGRMVDRDGARCHIVESGAGSPAVVLEAGIAASSLSWSLVQPEVAKFTRVVSYDRAGFGWSDRATTPCALRGLVDELRGLLDAAAVRRPIVLAGHSFGGLIARGYAAWYPDEIAGLVLVDPVLPAEWTDMREKQRRLLALGVKLSHRGAWMARFGLVRLTLLLLASGARAVPQWIARIASGKGSSVAGRLAGEIQKLPASLWPVIRAHWSDPKSFTTMAAYLAALPGCAAAVEVEPAPKGIPLTILSAAKAPERQTREWAALVEQANPGRHIVAAQSGHWIPFDQPDLIVEAIRAMVERQNSLTVSTPASS